MLSPRDFRTHAVEPALDAIGYRSPAATALLLGTAVMGSGLRRLCQPGGRLGFYGITLEDHDAAWDWALNNDCGGVKALDRRLGIQGLDDSANLAANPLYASAIAGLIYKSSGAPLPQAGDVEGLAAFWFAFFPHGPGTAAAFRLNFMEHVAEQVAENGAENVAPVAAPAAATPNPAAAVAGSPNPAAAGTATSNPAPALAASPNSAAATAADKHGAAA
jgi:hypothetical protein